MCSACKPDLPQTPTEKVVTAVFDPTTAKIPLPNDLVFPPFNTNLNSVCPPGATPPAGSTSACAQAELLATFNGAFPSDQEVAITIDFAEVDLHSNGVQSTAAPELDFASFTSTTYFVATVNGTTVTDVPTEPPTAADYARFPDHGTLTIHRKGHLPWAPGKYAVLVRGGPEGVKTTDGTPVAASQIFALIAQGKDLSDPANLGLLRAQTGSTDAAIAQGAQLNLLINAVYKPTAFVAADTRFPHEELAIAATFSTNPTTSVVVDAARGVVPLPIDLLREPTAGPDGKRHLSALAACTLAGAKLKDDGTCPSAAAGGFQALDGFATTGMILAQTSDLILANTVKDGVFLYDLSIDANPLAQVPVTDLVYEQCELTVNATNGMSGCTDPTSAANVSTAISLQPAGATRGDGSSVFRTKPLKDATDYLVVITNAVRDKTTRPLGPGTVGSILRFKNPIVVGGKSALQGVDDATAAGLETMRLQLQPLIAKLPADVQSKLVMAYTFHTQTILSQALGLAALPYSPAVQPQAPLPVTDSLTFGSATDAFHRWGVDTSVVPSGNIEEILEVDIETFNALDPITGAFMSDPTKAPKEKIHVLIATPKAANVVANTCLGGGGPNCSPMVVFRHGLGGGRGDMLLVADSFAAAGLTTVAIDAAKHGDRSFCTSGPASATTGCKGGGACMTLLPPGAQGDEHPPGSCAAAGGFIKRPISPTCAETPCDPAFSAGTPLVSGNYLTSSNLFRTRDTLRQDLIDQSQLVRAIAFVPTAPGLTGHSVFDHMVLHNNVVIDPSKIYYTGQSMGAIQGAVNVATNPRISKAVLNVGGGTIIDIFTNSPAFTDRTDALLASLGIQRGTPAFLQFLVVAKTVLDPADPINFVNHLTVKEHMLPNLLSTTGPALQAPKKILSQMANCDGVVPNAFGLIYASNLYRDDPAPGVPLPAGAAFFMADVRGPFQLFVGAGFDPRPTGTPFGTCPPPADPPTPPAVAHGFLTDWSIEDLTRNAQTDAAAFLKSDLLPLVVQHQ